MFPISVRIDIIRLLLVKAVALIVIYYAFFSAAQTPDGRAVAAHILQDNQIRHNNGN
jgi:hypothetical protein